MLCELNCIRGLGRMWEWKFSTIKLVNNLGRYSNMINIDHCFNTLIGSAVCDKCFTLKLKNIFWILKMSSSYVSALAKLSK